MHTTPYHDRFKTRVEIADNIYKTYARIGEADAQIILCCAIGSLSAMRWPDAEDNRRFIEFLTRFVPQTQIISIPILIEEFFEENDTVSADKLVSQYFRHPAEYNGLHYFDNQSLPESLFLRNLDSKQIDKTEIEIAKTLSIDIQSDGKKRVNPTWANSLLSSGKDKRQLIREASYAARIYTDFRCGLVHWYRAQNGVTSYSSPGRRDAPIYANLSIAPTDETTKEIANQYKVSLQDARIAFTTTKRRLYFPYEYFRDLMIEAANNAFDDWRKWDEPTSYKNIDVWAEPKPAPWWITKYGK